MTDTTNPNKHTTYISASCHCKSNTFRVAFTSALLPIENDLCHCNLCRHSSGQMAVNHVRISGGPYHLAAPDDPQSQSRPPPSPVQTEELGDALAATLTNLTQYRTSPVATRYFCKNCGAHMLWRQDSTWLFNDKENPTNQEIAKKFSIDLEGVSHGLKAYWCVAVGVLDQVSDGGIVKVGFHIFVEDTLDGGLVEHFRGGVENLDRWSTWARGSELLSKGWKAAPLSLSSTPPNENKLHFYCQCRKIELYVTRSTEEERFVARHCECKSCKRTSGFEVVSWGRVPVQNVYDQKTGKVVDFESHLPIGMKGYSSSPGGIKRYFCSDCGASVFLYNLEQLGMIELAMGLVDELQDGARAERWFEWSGIVG